MELLYQKWKEMDKGRAIVCLILSMLTLFLFLQKQDKYFGDVTVRYYDEDIDYFERNLSDGIMNQRFLCMGNMKKISILLKNKSEDKQKMFLRIQGEDGTMLCEQEVEVPVTGDTQMMLEIPVELDRKVVETLKNKVVILQLQEQSEDSELVIMIQDTTDSDELYQRNLDDSTRQIRMSIDYEIVRSLPIPYLIAGILFVAGILFLCFYRKKSLKLETMFLLVALIAGIGLGVTNPVCQECDGYQHLIRTMDVANGNVLSPILQLSHEKNTILVPENFNQLDLGVKIPPDSRFGVFQLEKLNQLSFSKNMIKMDYTGGVNSALYYVQAIGLRIGMLLGLNVFQCILMARMCNLLTFMVLVYFAIKKMPVYRVFFTLLALMPISIYQAASCSPDAILNGMCLLFIATCFDYTLSEHRKESGISVFQTLGLGIMLAIIFLFKYVYVAIGLLVFIIPKKRFGDTKQYLLRFGIALIPLIFVLVPIGYELTGSVQNLQSSAGNMTQTSFLLQNPIEYGKTIIRTLDSLFVYWVENLCTYGWLNYPLGVLLYAVPVLVFTVGILDKSGKVEELTKGQRGSVFGTFCAVFFLILTALYIGDGSINPVGADVILGVQGRYFIPILFLPFIAFGTDKVRNTNPEFGKNVIGMTTLALAYSLIQLVGYCY